MREMYECRECGGRHFRGSKIGIAHFPEPDTSSVEEDHLSVDPNEIRVDPQMAQLIVKPEPEGLVKDPSPASADTPEAAPAASITEEDIIRYAAEDPKFAVLLSLASENAKAIKTMGDFLNREPAEAPATENPLDWVKEYVNPEDVQKLVGKLAGGLFGDEGGSGSSGRYSDKLLRRLAEKIEEQEDQQIEEKTNKLMLALYDSSTEIIVREREPLEG